MHFSGKSATNYKRPGPEADCVKQWLTAHIRRVIFMLTLLLLNMPQSGMSATTGRFWSYFNLASLITPNWSFVVMPGIRYEFARANDALMRPNKELYFYELLAGPTYTKTWDRFTIKLPLWYYYMGFPSSADYAYAHNIEFLPILSYRSGKLALTSRTIFHNTIYASIYETPELKKGYSLVIRQFLQVTYTMSQRFSILLADEPFFGVIEDKEAPPSPIGFWPKGFRLNRLYAGFQYKITPRMAFSPQYVLETTYDEGSVTDTNHYLFVTLSYTFKVFW
jgi:hypothetical protein